MTSMKIIQFSTTQKKRVAALVVVVVGALYLLSSFRNKKSSSNDSHEMNEFLSESKRSLSFHKRKFYLDGKEFRIYAGSIHYFRVMPEYWDDSLKKLKALGLNTVETYCPWNLHEEVKGTYNFEGILNLRLFVKKAHEHGLYVIVRPGPYICAEFEFGGMPSWLLRDPNMKVRSMYFGFTKMVDEYFKQLMHEISDLQYSKGGPIIAFQIENEYGTFGQNQLYIEYLKRTMEKYGIVERLFLSDSNLGMHNVRPVKGGFVGVNFNDMKQSSHLIQLVSAMSPDFPIIITELWSGWFVTWGQKKIESISSEDLLALVEFALSNGYSFCLYMLQGGTNFGFMNGFNPFSNQPIITSYDYFAPISEAGEITDKYLQLRKLMMKHLPAEQVAKIPDVPETAPAHEYGLVEMKEYLLLDTLLNLVERPISVDHPLFMEELNINSNSGQGYGFILYRTEFKQAETLKIIGSVHDRGLILVNSRPLDATDLSKGVFNYTQVNPSFSLKSAALVRASITDKSDHNLDILVENIGRQHFANFQLPAFNQQRKGLAGSVWLDTTQVKSWRIFPLEFKKSMINKASSSDEWHAFEAIKRPALYRGYFTVDSVGKDTYVDMKGWTKGVVFINGFNLGRYWNIGPQRTLFLPSALLRSGKNELLVFELHHAHTEVKLINKHVFEFQRSD